MGSDTVEIRISENYQSMSLDRLTAMLRFDNEYRANYELAQRIIVNNSKAVNYYIGVLSLPIITHIEKKIIHRDILSEFYEFLSNPYNSESDSPEWHKVSLYKGETCRLDSYTSLITTRHFCKVAQKEQEVADSECEMIDYVDYQTILGCTAEDDEQEYSIGSKLWKARKSFQSLCERDQQVLFCLAIEKMTAIEAWPLLEYYISPRKVEGKTPEEIKESWTTRQKQNALSLIKGRAIEHFINIYNTL